MARLMFLVAKYCILLAVPLQCLSFLSPQDRPIPAVTADAATDTASAAHLACGRNSLYVFLRLHGVECRYDQLQETVPIAHDGTSILDLRNGASQLEFQTLVVRCRFEDLLKVDFPVIGWVQRLDGSVGPDAGHYIVVLSADQERVLYVDGTTAHYQEMTAESFRDAWNNVILVSRDAVDSQDSTWLRYGVLLLVAGASVVVVHELFRRRSHHLRTGTATVLVCLLISAMASAASGQREQDIWRTSENDAVNALYLLLRSHGVEAAYGDVTHAFPAGVTDLQTIRETSRGYGLAVEVVRCRSTADLAELELPFLLHRDAPVDSEGKQLDGRLGRICLVMRITGETYYLFECGHMLFRDVTEESLRQDWSGYALGIPKSDERSAARRRLWVSVVIGAIIVGVYQYKRGS